MNPDDLHDLAIEAGATVLGEPGTRQYYLLTLEQLRAFLDPDLPPCPVPLPLLFETDGSAP